MESAKLNWKGTILLLFCGCVLIVIFMSLFHASFANREMPHQPHPKKSPTADVPALQASAKTESHMTVQPSSQTEMPSAQQSERVILIWTKYFNWAGWGLLHDNRILPCAKYNVNVSCRITYDKKEYEHSDLVAFHGRGADFSPNNLPDLSKRPPRQRWMYYNRESPVNQGILANPSVGKKFNGLFNWTMTMKLDSDIDFRAYRILPGKYPEDYHLNRTNKIVVAVISNCQSDRLHYIHELQKYIDIHIYGRCGTYQCPGGVGCFGMLKKSYNFYLSFENSICKDYVTEKFYRNALMHNMLPVVINGGDFSDPTVAPPGCCIKASDFKSARQLAEHIKKVASNSTLYNSYFKWHSQYTVQEDRRDEAFCRACQKLYTDSTATKVYDDLSDWFSVKKNCFPYPKP